MSQSPQDATPQDATPQDSVEEGEDEQRHSVLAEIGSEMALDAGVHILNRVGGGAMDLVGRLAVGVVDAGSSVIGSAGDAFGTVVKAAGSVVDVAGPVLGKGGEVLGKVVRLPVDCLLYTSDAADE